MEYKKAVVLGMGGPEGIYSNTRGEGRWSSNVAVLFRKYGMEVDALMSADISKEYKDEQYGINFIKEYSELANDYDLFFKFSPFYKDDPDTWNREFKPRVKKALFGNFWPGVNDVRPFPDGMLVSPYRSFNSNTGILPYMFVDEFEKPKFDNKTIVWTNRGPFNTSMGEQRVIVNLFHLRATLDAVKEGYRAIFLCYGGDFLFEAPNFKLQNQNIWIEIKNTIEELKTYENVEFHSYITQDKFTELLKQGSVAIRCDASGSFSACLSYGLVPTVFTPWFWPVYFDRTEIPGLDLYPYYDSVPEQVIKDQIKKLLIDREYYDLKLRILRENTPIFTTKQALNHLQNILSVL
jgi:hypothetical protein